MVKMVIDPNYDDTLTPRDIELRENFVRQYLIDYDPVRACLRVGFNAAAAESYAQQFMSDSYVHKAIARQRKEQAATGEDSTKTDVALVMHTLREAAQHGPYASRVSAASQLAKIIGLLNDDGKENADAEIIEALREFAGRAPS